MGNTTPTITVRPARHEDASRIAAAHVAGRQHGYAGVYPDEHLYSMSTSSYTQSWEKRLSEGEYTVYVGEVDGEVAAFISFEAGGCAQIHAVYTHPEHWRRGAGRAIMDAVLEEIAGHGCERATLWTLEKSARSRGFYAAGGWEPTGLTLQDERFPNVTHIELERLLR